MPKFAFYDSTAQQPTRVRGWYDTDSLKYPKLPEAKNLLQLTQMEWDSRMIDPSGWAVQDGKLVPWTGSRIETPPTDRKPH